jgi:transposase-like protein
MMIEKGKRAAYTLEFKLEAVRLVQGGQAKVVTAKVLGIPVATLSNWVRLAVQGKLIGAGAKPVCAAQEEELVSVIGRPDTHASPAPGYSHSA